MPELTPLDDNRQEHFLNGENLEPITRREHFYAGRESELPEGHQEPETREEWFIKKYRGGGGDITVESLSVTSNGTYTAPSGKAYSPVNVNVPLPQNAYLLKSVNTPTPIASFSDGEEMVMPSLKVAIEPQQDLHGYDAPWPGGAGKNKLQVTATTQTVNGITYTVNDDGTINANGTANADSRFNFGTYIAKAQSQQIMNGLPDSVTDDSIDMGYQGYGVINKTTRQLEINRNADKDWNNDTYILIKSGTTVNNLVFKPMIRLASVTDSTFAPYSNICPISGWDECNVTRAGKNLFDKVNCGVYNGYIAGTQVYGSPNHRTIYIPCKPNTTYSSANFSGNNRKALSYSSEVPSAGLVVPTPLDTITTDANAKYLLCYCYNANIDTVTFDDVKNALDIELGSVVPTSYSAYNGSTYTIDLDGTRYGGEVDVVSGVLTVDRVLNTIDQNSTIQFRSTGRALTFIDAYKTVTMGGVNIICDKLKSAYYSNHDSAQNGEIATVSGSTAQTGISFKISDSITSLDELKAWLTSNPLTIVTNLATPLTIQLTPTAVKSLLGSNNVWADTGDITDAEYFSKEV